MNKSLKNSRGSTLVCIMVALLIVMGLTASILRSALQARQTVRQERQVSQVRFLLEAGIERAVSKLQHDGNYRGEAWQLDGEVLPGWDSALVKIEVSPAEVDGTSNVHIVSQLPADSPHSVQQSFKFTFSNTVPSNEEQ